MSKTISFSLNPRSIQNAMNEVAAYKMDVERKTRELAKRIAEVLEEKIASKFAGAVADMYFNREGEYKDAPDYSIGTDGNGNSYVVWTSGQDAIFVEFGTGVYYNGSAGTSPHPTGNELGFTIGSYGKGMGKRRTWGFKRDGITYLTHGIPAVMPMYRSAEEVAKEIEHIAGEVFGK